MKVITETAEYRGIQGIYAIVNIQKPLGECPYGKPYVGQTIAKPWEKKHTLGIGHRVCAHRYKLRQKKHHNPKLQLAWIKYGEHSFIFIVVEVVEDRGLLTEREQYWIDKWDACKKGYNIAPIAQSGLGLRWRSDLMDDQLIGWIEKHKQDNGKFPNCHSGSVVYAPNDEPITWSGVNACLQKTYRGRNGDSSLSRFISEHFDVVTKSTSKCYTDEILLQWIGRFYDDNGCYPTKRSGDIPWVMEAGYSPTTWDGLDRCLRKGYKGFFGDSSLYRFIKGNYGCQHKNYKG